MDFYTNLTFKVQNGRGVGSCDPISKFCDPLWLWIKWSICFKFGTEMEDGPSCVRTSKWPLSRRGQSHVTQFRNFVTPLQLLNEISYPLQIWCRLEVCGSTRTRGYGSGRVDFSRVGSGTGTTSTGMGIPGFTPKEHDFSRFWSENLLISACFLNYLWWSNYSMARENSILLRAYNRLLTYFLALLCWLLKKLIQYGMWAVMKSWDGPKTDHIDKSNLHWDTVDSVS